VEIVSRFTSEKELRVGNEIFTRPAPGAGWYSTHAGKNIFDFLKGLDEVREEYLADFIRRYNYASLKEHAGKEYWKLMTPAQVKQLSDSPCAYIGTHTHRHYNLANVNEELVVKELTTSKELLEQVTGKTIDMIAFPDGSYNDKVKELTRKAGLTKMLAVTYKCKNDEADALILPRLSISNTTTFESNMFAISKSFDKLGF
jgi:peptidoglycan/xylan/chitin deacetylase (PgdA/CDA1 family)